MNLFLALCAATIFSARSAQGEDLVKTDENYCPYFKNRAPSPQPNLKNCTWYKKEACCLQSEVALIFDNVPPPSGASDKCVLYMNFLMCYVCAPDQNLFYRNERLTVCESFCDKWFNTCKDAQLKGVKIKELFKSGKEFCQARKFLVQSESSSGCFSFEQEIRSLAASTKSAGFPLVLVAALVVYLITVRGELNDFQYQRIL